MYKTRRRSLNMWERFLKYSDTKKYTLLDVKKRKCHFINLQVHHPIQFDNDCSILWLATDVMRSNNSYLGIHLKNSRNKKYVR